MKYESQRLAYPYFVATILLLVAQVIYGLLGAAQYIWGDFLFAFHDFNLTRELHTNLLVVGLLMGFMGATYYLVPEESQSEIYSPLIAIIQFWAFLGGAVAGIVGYYFGITEGREFLELPRYLDVAVVAVVLMFLYNVYMTIYKSGRWTAIQIVLLMGLVGAALLYIPGMIDFKNVAEDKFYWWWNIHLWVEGVWELIMGAILAFLLIKLTGVDREIVEKWLYVIVGLALFTGILGTGHHYYWIGTPEYWIMIGGIFSALEPLSFLAMVVYAFYLNKISVRNHPNQLALYWSLGTAVMAFLGAGVFGIAHTFPSVNAWTHGTQITASHGHLAFWGAYMMLNLSIIAFAIPELAGKKSFATNTGLWAFWLMNISMTAIGMTLFGAGVVQVYLERMLGMDYVIVQQQYMKYWYVLRFIWGWFFLAGVLVYAYQFFTEGRPVSGIKKSFANEQSVN